MKLRLDRDWPLLDRTIGRLYVDDAFFCFTCEDRVRHGPKVAGETAIPVGSYTVLITDSAHFKRPMPLVCGVPGFSGIRIHPGHDEQDTEGCILVGWIKDGEGIYDSRRAFDALFRQIEAALKVGEPVTLEVAEPVAMEG